MKSRIINLLNVILHVIKNKSGKEYTAFLLVQEKDTLV